MEYLDKHCYGNGLQKLANSLILTVRNKILCKVCSVGNLISNGSYTAAGFIRIGLQRYVEYTVSIYHN